MSTKPMLLLLATLFSLPACSEVQTASSGNANAPKTKSMAAITPPKVGPDLPAKLCEVLKKVAPEVRNMSPVGARAQLVIAIAAAFDANAAALQEVSEKIDVIALGSCPVEREILLSAVEMKTLQDAVR
jgi:hypothetical protein